LKNLTNKLIKSLGRDNYTLDPSLSSRSLRIILSQKIRQALRGYWLKLFLKESKGIIFLGKGTKIKHQHLIKAGKSLTIGDRVEINALSKQGIKIGDGVSILSNSIIECTGVIRNLGEGLEIGNKVGIAQNAFIQVRGKVIIEDKVIFGPGVSIFSENHNSEDPDIPISQQGETRMGVTIMEGSWIGANATILDGVIIGKNSIIAAGSLVNKSIPDYSIAAGVPAKIVKTRKSSVVRAQSTEKKESEL